MMNGLRLKQVREFLGLAQQELAQQLSVTQATVAYLEAGYQQPSEDLLSKICESTGFPQAFFEQTEIIEFPYGSLLYRSRAVIDASEKTRTNRYGQFMFEVAEKLSQKISPRHFPFPKGRIDGNTAASIVRSNLGYSPDRPIDDLIYDLEKNGVYIFKSPFHCSKIDAFSVWAGYDNKKPVVVLTKDVSADRVRWTVAHEFGHLILHPMLFGDLQEFEREADMFAAELLLPEVTMTHLVVEPFTLTRAARIKAKWKVSIQAIVRRAHELHLISDSSYKSLHVQMSQQKEKLQALSESDIPEKPRSLRAMAERLYGNEKGRIDYRQLFMDTHLPIPVLKQFMEAQANQAEYTKKPPQQASILEFPSKRSLKGSKESKLLEG